MRYVLDSCVALKWVLPESDTPKAVRIRTEFIQGTHELIAPDVFPAEVAHALARAERKGILRPPAGARRLQNILTCSPVLHPYLPLLPRAFALASHVRIGVYDCLYVALAEREKCRFLTADARLVRVLEQSHPSILLLETL